MFYKAIPHKDVRRSLCDVAKMIFSSVHTIGTAHSLHDQCLLLSWYGRIIARFFRLVQYNFSSMDSHIFLYLLDFPITMMNSSYVAPASLWRTIQSYKSLIGFLSFVFRKNKKGLDSSVFTFRENH